MNKTLNKTLRTITRWLPAALALYGFSLAAAEQRPFIDSAGRPVRVPASIERVFAAGPPAAILLYVLAPDKLLNWPHPLGEAERSFIAAPYRDLPALGRLTGHEDTADLEVVLKARPDIILDVGSTAPTYVSLADRVQQQTGLPYLLIDGTLANTPAALRQLGSVLKVVERAERLARYTEQVYRELDAALAQIPPARRPRVYLARGPQGLETGRPGSINTEIIERVGAVNVADVPGQPGPATVSIEQVCEASGGLRRRDDAGPRGTGWDDRKINTLHSQP